MLIAGIMGQDCMKFLPMCIDSLKDADKIVYIDGGSKDNSIEYAKNKGVEIIENKWEEDNKKMNGIQRNVFLNFIKEKYPNDWCIFCDADEIVEDLTKIKEFIQLSKTNSEYEGIYSVKMRHLIGDLGHEDATQKKHLVFNRLFKISEAKEYPLESHPVLIPNNSNHQYQTDCTTIWHLGHLPVLYLDYILKRYKQNVNDSIIHNQEFLKAWKMVHLFGQYPKREINHLELPKQLYDRYEIDFDELYFHNRGIELKHFIDAIHWKEYFKPKYVVEFGCGLGPRVYALNNIGIKTLGIELNKYAVKNSYHRGAVQQGDVRSYDLFSYTKADLVIAYDLLEHINYEDLDKAINTIVKKSSKHILISVPVIGNPHLLDDPTHIIKESRDWWISKFVEKGCKLIDTPSHFLYRDQILIFKGGEKCQQKIEQDQEVEVKDQETEEVKEKEEQEEKE